MMRCLEECRKQWRPKQGKSGWQKQKEEEKRQEQKEQKIKEQRKPKREKIIEIKRVAKEWEIWDIEEKEAAKSEEETKQLVPERFHKWIHVFGKKTSKQMPTRKP